MSEQNYDLELFRLDMALFKAPKPSNEFKNWLDSSAQKHELFINRYCLDIMQVGKAGDSATAARLLQFREDTLWQGLQKDIESYYPNFDKEKQELSLGVKRLRSFFPNLAIPKLYTFNSGFNVAVYPGKEYLGVGLEWFLDTNNNYVEMLPPQVFPAWKRKHMMQDYLVSDALRGWILHNFYDDYYFETDLLRQMVFYGKALLLTEVALDDATAAEVLKYSESQFDWAIEHQEDVWESLVKEELLFSTDFNQINRMTLDGPFTNTYGASSAPRLGWFLGYAMVAQYAESSGKSLPEIINEHNEREILNAFRASRSVL